MVQPITWRNVQSGQNLGGVARLMENGSQGVQNMLTGLRDVGNEIVSNRVDANRRDLQQYMDSFQSPEEYQAALDSGAFQERINTYGEYVDDSFAGMPQNGLQTSRSREQANVQYQDWVTQRGNTDLRKQIVEADPRTAMELLESNRDTLGEQFYSEQVTARQAQVQGLNAIAAENSALSKERIREHRYGTRFNDDPRADIKKGTGFTARQKMEDYRTLSSADIGTLSADQRNRLGSLVREMTGNASLEQYRAQVMSDLNNQLQTNAITPAQYGAIRQRFDQEFQLFDDEGYLDSADLKADINTAQDLALRTPGPRTNVPIKDNQWYTASQGETLSPDAAVSSLLAAVNKDRADEDKVPPENITDLVSALYTATQSGMSDGQGNKAGLPLTQGVVDIIASAYENSEWFGVETNDSPEELARAIAVATNSADALADFTEYQADFQAQKTLLRRNNDEVNRLKDARDAYFKRVSRASESTQPTPPTTTTVQNNMMSLARAAQEARERESALLEGWRNGEALSLSDRRKARDEVKKAERAYEQFRDANKDR